MDLIYWVLIAAAVLAAVITLTVVVKHHGEKVRNDLHADNQQDNRTANEAPPVDAEQIQLYLSLHEKDHDDIAQLFAKQQFEFDSYIETGHGAPSLLLEHLHQLDEKIDLQINEDNEWLEHFSPQDRQNVTEHHRQWVKYQTQVRYMIYQLS